MNASELQMLIDGGRRVVAALVVAICVVPCLADDWGTPFHDKWNTSTTSDAIRPPLRLVRTIDLRDYWRGGPGVGWAGMSGVPSYEETPPFEIRVVNGRLYVDQCPRMGGCLGMLGQVDLVTGTFRQLVTLYRFGTLCVTDFGDGEIAGLGDYDSGFPIVRSDGSRFYASPWTCSPGGNWGGAFNADAEHIYTVARKWDIGNSCVTKIAKADGQCVWSTMLPTVMASYRRRAVGVPVILDASVIIEYDGWLKAFDLETGTELWSRGDFVWVMDVCRDGDQQHAFGPVYRDGVLYVRMASYGVDPVIAMIVPLTGEVIGVVHLDEAIEFPLDFGCDLNQFVIHDGTVILPYPGRIQSRCLVPGVNPAPLAWEVMLDGNPKVMLSRDVAYTFGGSDVMALDAATGSVLWRATVDTPVADILLADDQLWALAGTSVYVFAPAPSCDFDRDGDVDLADFLHFQECFAGPNIPLLPDCGDADFDDDNDVDLTDFAVLQEAFGGQQ